MKSVKHILIHVGVSNLDKRSPEHVFEHLRAVVVDMRKKYEGSRLTCLKPHHTTRNDKKDNDVVRCNKLTEKLGEETDYVTLA